MVRLLMASAAERIAHRRAAWTFGRDTDARSAEDADIDFWLRIPIDERAIVAWELSEEVYGWLGDSDGEAERRLPRSALRVIRREG
jgi:hypothetical protein